MSEQHTPRVVWVGPDDVDGPLTEGRIVRATRPLADFALRSQDGSAPIPAGRAVEIVEVRPYGRALAHEQPPQGDTLDAALDLQADGLFEVGTTDSGAEESAPLPDRPLCLIDDTRLRRLLVHRIDGVLTYSRSLWSSEGLGWTRMQEAIVQRDYETGRWKLIQWSAEWPRPRMSTLLTLSLAFANARQFVKARQFVTAKPLRRPEPLRNGDEAWLFSPHHSPTRVTVNEIHGDRVKVSDGAGWSDCVDRERLVKRVLGADA